MISSLYTLILGIIQGITEFLPVSSSGHLLILEKIFRITNNIVVINLALHLGTALSAIYFFKDDIILAYKKQDKILIRNLAIAFIVTSIFGFLFKNIVEKVFIYSNTLIPLALGFILTAILLWIISKSKENHKNINNLTLIDSIKIGFAQAVAIAPGISRSGITYFTAIKSGINKDDAFKFSFLLSIPTILAATFVELVTNYDVLMNEVVSFNLLLGLIISFIFGILGLYIFKRIIKTSKIWMFSIYLLILSAILFII